MTALVVILLAIYPVVAIVLVIGMRRLPRSVPGSDAECPSVSVVVTARNEAESLSRCVDALLAIDYPKDRIDFVLVDDRSTDGTGEWMDALAKRGVARLTVLHTAQLPDNGLDGKSRGIAHGMARATGEWILITDADARVPSTWARHLVGRVDARTAVVGGTAIVDPRHWWGIAEGLTWGFLQTINLGAAGWTRAVVCVGPNMGIRRATYEACGGLECSPFSMADDLAISRMAAVTGGTLNAYGDPETTVLMEEVPSPLHLMSQWRRFAAGALESGPEFQYLLPIALVWGVALAVFLLVGWIFMPTVWGAWVFAKVVADAALMRELAQRTGVARLTSSVAQLWLVQLGFMAWLPASLILLQGSQWRGVDYSVKYE